MTDFDTRIVRNAIQTPDGTIIESNHRHDYVSHVDEVDGETYMVDGGLDYIRRSNAHKDLSVFMGDGHEVVRANLSWGTYGKDGTEPYHRIFLKDMETSHIQACLDTQHQMYPQVRESMETELKYRESRGLE